MTDYVQLRSGVVIPAASFAEAIGPAELNEIATIERDITKTPFASTLRNEDETLITRGGGKGLKIYDELERDCHASAVLDKRKTAVIKRNWNVIPASEDAQDVAVAQFVTDRLQAIQLDRITRELLDATLKGYSVGEIMWGVEGDAIVVRDVIPRDQRRFVFNTERQLQMLTRSNMTSGEPMPDRKFVVHTVGAKDGSPYGLGLGSKLFWPVLFKRKGITFWLVFCDKFGSPTAVGKYPRGAKLPEQRKLLAMLQAIAQDSGVIVPEGTTVEFLEAARNGSIDTYERLVRYMDEQISKAVLGETMSTTAQAGGLGSSQANVQNEVRIELAKADGDLLSDTLNATLVKWLVDYNFTVKKYPKLYRDFGEDEDLNQRAERDEKIGRLGYEPDEKYIKETYGPGWTKKAPGTGFNPFGAPPAFAEPTGKQREVNREAQDAIVDAAEQAATDYQTLIGRRVEDLLAMVEETGDLAQFRERMNELLDAEPSKELVEAVARAGFAAHVIGRAQKPKE